MNKAKDFLFYLKRIIEKYSPIEIKYLLYLAGSILIFILYDYDQKREQETHVIHQKFGHGIQGGRTLGNERFFYERKEKIIYSRLNQLEDSFKALKNTFYRLQTEILDAKEKAKEMPSKDTERPGPVEFKDAETDLTTEHIPPSSDKTQSFKGTRPLGTSQIRPLAKQSPRKRRKGPSVISFPVASTRKKKQMGVKVPAGAYLKAKILTGVEAGESRPVPVLLQADFFFVGPNRSRIDLSGCFIIAKSKGNLSIERVEMQVTKMSCVSPSGKMFERPINGFAADGANTSFGVSGLVNSKQSRVASMAFLSSVVQGISQALQQAQTTTQSNALGGSSLRVTGSQTKYLAGSGAGNAASLVTNWYLKHAQNLLPTINIGSGQDVWIILQESINLPFWYFKKTTRSQDQVQDFFPYLQRKN